ncbi:MAG: hypothetical protein TEF_01690 [Rhizobiales bacterium NRL2]|jgi:outer membrane protein OmpA-like peptidoglycan-associated protein|nr:MAG: hypothetical protein TEF_01690 [Rhizobiales bacterium NRL2]
MKRRLTAVAAAALALLPAAALAELDGPYLAGGVLGQHVGDRELSGGVAGDLEMAIGAGGLAAFGYQFRTGIRLETELSYRHNRADSFNGANVNGSFGVLGGLVNLVWEYDNDSGIYPYVGGGIGIAQVQANDFDFGGGRTLDDGATELAMQGLAGVAFALDPNLSLIAEYRYFRTGEAEFRDSTGATIDASYAAHTAVLGLRYRFGEPPRAARAATSVRDAAAAAMPAAKGPKESTAPRRLAPARPAAAVRPRAEPLPNAQARAAASLRRSYVVFFALDSAELGPEARETVAEASDRARQDGTAVIELAGHADRSGDAAYNRALSERRARNTAAEIRSHGVQAVMDIEAHGETQPLVPTADGVYEPRNRRVEIVLQGQGDGLNVSRN